jgi:hypothetical protein
MQTMSLLRLKSWLAMGTLVLTLSSVASAQHLQPFGPVDFEEDRQPFAPPDVSEYDLGPPERNGFFVSFERLYLAITAPDRVVIGSTSPQTLATFAPDVNTLDTSWLKANYAWANRIEGGYRDGKHGWLATGLWTTSQWQQLVGPGETILFDDPNGILNAADFFTGANVGPEPPPFTLLDVKNVTRMMGVELLHTYRFNPGRWGGEWELFCGARYLQFNDEFRFAGVTAFDSVGNPIVFGFNFDGSFTDTIFQNNMVGPEIGLRMANRRERWTFVTEGRFAAAGNFIDGQQHGQWVNNAFFPVTFPSFPSVTFSNAIHEAAFSPIGEFRLESSYALTKAIAFKFGYTAMIIGNVARASSRVFYSVPNMGFNSRDPESVFINGVTFGIEINR